MFNKFYNLLYYGAINEKMRPEKSYTLADIGDMLIAGDKKAAAYLAAERQDIVASDREAAAFAFWYIYKYQKKALEYISRAAYDSITNEIVKLYNDRMI